MKEEMNKEMKKVIDLLVSDRQELTLKDDVYLRIWGYWTTFDVVAVVDKQYIVATMIESHSGWDLWYFYISSKLDHHKYCIDNSVNGPLMKIDHDKDYCWRRTSASEISKKMLLEIYKNNKVIIEDLLDRGCSIKLRSDEF